jgi:L-rhamnose isomerase
MSLAMKRQTTMTRRQVNEAYAAARAQYRTVGVDTERALRELAKVALSLHCWQGDDVRGLEDPDAGLTGGIVATGNYPGVARNGEELRADMLKACSLIPGIKRANIHAFYAETDGARIARDKLTPAQFKRWMRWSKKHGIALDFNPTFFSHPKAASGMTLSSADENIRRYWIRHGIACRKIAQALAENQGSPCVCNFWIPDGTKDIPADRWSPRARLADSYARIFEPAHGIDTRKCIDTVEPKLFGIGSEEYTVGSHEFYLAYAVKHGVTPCLDMGHFHPTETIHDKLSAMLTFCDRVLLHVSRGIRWDSDHIVILNDDVKNVFAELVRGDALHRIYLALDYFDASVNRIAAWVIGARATQQALLAALLEPRAALRACEECGDGAGRLALLENSKLLPLGAVWNYYCQSQDVPVGLAWLEAVRAYEARVLSKRV